ncbi:hypothetical protein HY991_01405 [Candidatus Micrarchaeota archaeon]|nr:hypothetical protein [Candidatus Micrarchaeota archaeon]
MSKISEKTFNKIAESVLGLLYDKFPLSMSTVEIADELARDNEFIARVLKFLESKKYVERLEKSNSGVSYTKWMRWKLRKEIKARYDEA